MLVPVSDVFSGPDAELEVLSLDAELLWTQQGAVDTRTLRRPCSCLCRTEKRFLLVLRRA